MLTESGVDPALLPGHARRRRAGSAPGGSGFAGGFEALAIRSPTGSALIDELGELTFGEIDRRSNALADALAELGVGEGDGVAMLCRNHRGFLDASLAAAKLGADMLYLNTAFAGAPAGRGLRAREAQP